MPNQEKIKDETIVQICDAMKSLFSTHLNDVNSAYINMEDEPLPVTFKVVLQPGTGQDVIDCEVHISFPQGLSLKDKLKFKVDPHQIKLNFKATE